IHSDEFRANAAHNETVIAELRARQQVLARQALELSGMLILAMPGIVLATGFFLLLNNSIGLPESADG
ncbi:hypothetical protein, partial [Streptococcus pneumoniae]|uniref:hypothetical protein n=1 Tax=Streptococcus pneumoniae TaxID=1313 RepID=UPI0013DD2758